MSLTTCLKKAGSALSRENKAALISKSRALRGEGVTPQEAAIRAVTAMLTEMEPRLRPIRSRPSATKPAAQAAKPAAPTEPAPAEPKTSVIRGGQIDFELLMEAGVDPRMRKAIRLVLGVDEEGNRQKPMSYEAAAAEANIGDNSKAAVSKAMKALGITPDMRSRFLASDRTVNVDAATADTESTEEDVPTKPTEVALSEEDTGNDKADREPSLEDRGMGGIGNVGGSQGRIEAAPEGLLGNRKWYVDAVEKGLAKLSNESFASLVARATPFAVDPETGAINKKNRAALDVLMAEVRARSRNPEFAAAAERAYTKEYDATQTKDSKSEAADAGPDEAGSVSGPDGADEVQAGPGERAGQEASGTEATRPAAKVIVKKRRVIDPTQKSRAKREDGTYHNVESLEDALLSFMETDSLGRSVTIVESAADLSDVRDLRAYNDKDAVAWAREGRAYLIADRIQVGKERGVFLHEVGGHLGLETMLTGPTYDRLFHQVRSWATRAGDSIEKQLAQRAVARFKATGVNDIVEERAEVVAYFIEEAVNAGIDPTANSYKGELARWLRTVYAAFKSALRKLGVKIDTLTAQDVVDLAYGAAKLKVSGKWHGTAANVHQFRNKYMGTGEGAQAYGWGQYFSEIRGVATDYRNSDVARKTKTTYTYDGGALTNQAMRNVAHLASHDYKHRGPGLDVILALDNQKVKMERLVVDTKLSLGMEKARGAPWDSPSADKVKHIAELEASLKEYEQQIIDLDALEPHLFEPGKAVAPKGNLYATDFTIADDEWLDWNKPLREQSPKVQSILRNSPYGELFDSESDGETVYLAVADEESANSGSGNVDKHSKQRASEALDALGVKGIKVPVRNTSGRRGEDGYNFVVFNDTNIIRAMNNPNNKARLSVQYSKAAPAHMQEQSFSAVEKNVQRYPAALRPAAREIHRILGRAGRKTLNYINFTEDLLNRAADAGLKSATKYKDIANQRASFVGHHERTVQSVTNMYDELPDKLKGKGPGTANTFLYDSTMSEKWGYQPQWLDEKVEVDPEMAKQYAALGTEGQAFVDAAFRLGYDTLALKKQTVMDNVSTAYDGLIKAAKNDGDLVKIEEYEGDKKTALKQFGSLMKLSGKTPYSPLKRFGNFVVIAKSDAYLAADAAEQKKLERDENHYYVDFAESDRAASAIRDQLIASGKYSKSEEGVFYREKELGRDKLFLGSGTIQALSKLRSQIDAEYDARAETAKDPSEKDRAKKLHEMVTEMYLLALAEGSARKNELRRRGVAGDIDMVRALESQGKADANFLGTIRYNEESNEALNDMRREMKQGGDKLAKSEFFNEIMARHLQSMDYKQHPVADKVTNLVSKWFLAFSPSYYLQNATQPWMMSLPLLAGRHDMGAASKAMFEAYQHVAAPFKDAKVWGQMDFDAMLGDSNKDMTTDEKAMLQKLLDSGRIDIGMATELGQFRIEGKSKVASGWNKVDSGIRGLQQKLEALNRVTTALAAYRLEKGKTGSAEQAEAYADKLVQDTHGDYSAWNAPRAFNNGFGKVALQFKKFQLIQLSLMAKLLRNSFGDAEPEAKAAARKALAYMLGQAFVVGGGRALPLPAVLGYFFSAAFGDGADEPPEYVLRKWIDNKDVADLLIGGVPALFGANMSNFGGMGNMLSVLPFTDVDLTSRRGIETVGFALLTGPLGGLTLKAADAAGFMANGDYWRGIENMLPTGFGNMSKSLREATQGNRQKDGDQTIAADEITLFDAAIRAIGITPERQTRRVETQKAAYQIEQAIHNEGSQIKNDYNSARKKGDTAAMSEARDEWEAYQTKRIKLGFKRQPMSDLMASGRDQNKRERNTVGGVQYRKDNEQFVRDLAGR
jgi:hypothetical protein